MKKQDAPTIDFSKLSTGSKLILFPIFVKLFGLFKATILLYGK